MGEHKNRIPGKVRTIHVIAVCGTAMAALACMVKDLGFQVTGSDQNVYPPMSTYLDQRGVRVFEDYLGSHLDHGPDLVIVGNAVSKDNPEVVRMHELGLNYCSMPQAVNHFIAAGKKALVVTGTHGKTTTASVLAWVLEFAGYSPSFMIGGILNNFNRNYRLGRGKFIVLEGDEYDTAYFDKGPKFLHFDPTAAILTGIEFDHADIYRDLAHVKQAFSRFVNAMADESALVAHDAIENIDSILRDSRCRIQRYGKQLDSYWRLGEILLDSPWTVFEIFKRGALFGRFRSPMMGDHNLLNTLSAVAVADSIGIPAETIGKAVEGFKGVKRRQEVRGIRNGVTVIDDFAHHPTAVRETIRAVKPYCKNGRLIAVFEPRTNTSMRGVFQDAYAESFDMADITCIRHPPLLKKIPAGERFSSKKLVNALKRRGREAHFSPDTDSIVDYLVDVAESGDIILIMSNGGFDNIHERLLELLQP